MKPSLQLRLGHQLTMTPQLQQAIRLLQLSSVDIQREIQSALESNTLLELNESVDSVQDDNGSVSDEAEIPQAHTWQDKIVAPTRLNTPSCPSESLVDTQPSLKDHLLGQMRLARLNDTDHLIATIIIDSINDDGYLSCSLDDIITTAKQTIEVDKAEVEAVLHRIQQFDPIGVGARNIGECLELQLQNLHPTPIRNKACELVTHHIQLLAKRDYATLKRRLGLSSDKLQLVIQSIKSLNPKPGTKIGYRTTEYIVPDVFTYKRHGQWSVTLNRQWTPRLQINQYYAALLQENQGHHQFLRHQLQEARWFLKSIENRNETLLKVAQCIVNAQVAFLESGEAAMKPLILQDVAKVLNLHESTISRITTQKYLYTPRGTFELKYFFSSHVSTDIGGECSATAIRALIKKMISHENHLKPLSDSKLSKLLAEQGILVARRTVAKYREGMNFPPSHERKQLF